MTPKSSNTRNGEVCICPLPKQILLKVFDSNPNTGAGSKHDDHCCICPGPQRLVECHTCKIAFHPECLPRFSHILPNVAFHCSICVDRCWDLSPPDTLPGSLEPSSAQIHYPPTRTTTDKPNDASNPYLRDPTQQEGLRTQSATSVYEHRGTDRSTSHDIAHPGPAVQTATESPQRTEHQRNLDYTLSSDVFSSLYRLYRELESVASLRAEIEELRSQNTRFAEIIKVNRRFRDILLEGVRSPQIMGTQFVGTVESISDTFADLEVELGITEGQTVPAKEPK